MWEEVKLWREREEKREGEKEVERPTEKKEKKKKKREIDRLRKDETRWLCGEMFILV